MSAVRLEVLSSLAETLDTDSKADAVTLEQEITEGTTVRDVLNLLNTEHQRFVQVIFDVKAQKQTERVNIFLNGRNLELADGLATALNDGDVLTFVSPIIGG